MKFCWPLLLALASTTWAQGDLQAARALLEAAQESDNKKGFEYKAYYMYYFEEGDSLVLRGSATVLHKESVLEAAEMVYYR